MLFNFYLQLTVVVIGGTFAAFRTFCMIMMDEVVAAYDPNFMYGKLIQGLMLAVSTILADMPCLLISRRYNALLYSSCIITGIFHIVFTCIMLI